ncbi:hypothetical protein [Paenisporosarcina indica]|uniref:hypothetical protein n=1 Tax=Paenisporosarcina indica TaxID=650093 RepID=UPI000A8CA4B0|nr:hypothetical protein [Paenisporosarcina indica]
MVADFQLREKVRKIVRSTTEESQVPEKAKSLGFGCFTIGMIVVILLFAFISVGLLIQSYWIAGGVILTFTLGLSYITVQLIRADKLHN